MGGGGGISIPGMFRVATDKTVCAILNVNYENLVVFLMHYVLITYSFFHLGNQIFYFFVLVRLLFYSTS